MLPGADVQSGRLQGPSSPSRQGLPLQIFESPFQQQHLALCTTGYCMPFWTLQLHRPCCSSEHWFLPLLQCGRFAARDYRLLGLCRLDVWNQEALIMHIGWSVMGHTRPHLQRHWSIPCGRSFLTHHWRLWWAWLLTKTTWVSVRSSGKPTQQWPSSALHKLLVLLTGAPLASFVLGRLLSGIAQPETEQLHYEIV